MPALSFRFIRSKICDQRLDLATITASWITVLPRQRRFER
jgi:hypothetical protein